MYRSFTVGFEFEPVSGNLRKHRLCASRFSGASRLGEARDGSGWLGMARGPVVARRVGITGHKSESYLLSIAI